MHSLLGRSWPIAALVAATFVLIIPLWVVHTPGMPDYPAHLASFALISGGASVSKFYAVHWAFVPNLASELIVPLLGKLMSLNAATKLFLSVAMAMWVFGPAAIQRAVTGKLGPEPLAGAFFAYNANFTWGFFNYYFAVGLSFIVFAAWIRTAKRRGLLALAGFTLAASALYACHLIGAVIFLVMAGTYEATQAWEERGWSPVAMARRLFPLGAIFLPAAFAYLFLKPAGTGGGDLEFNFGDTLGDRLAATIQSYYSEPAYLLIGALAILVFAGFAYGKLRIVPSLRPLVLVLALLALVSPEWALGGWGVDLRLPAVFGSMVFAAMEWNFDRRAAAILGAGLLLAACWIAATMASSWAGYDKQYQEFRAALAQIPQGSKIVTAIDSNALDKDPDQPYWHMAEFAIPDRGAFTSLMFATKGQHIVEAMPPYDRLAAGSAEQGSPPDVTELEDLSLGRANGDADIEEVFPYLKFFQCHYDIAVVVTGNGKPSDVPDILTLRHAGSFFSLYDIHPTSACGRK
jgi:hypothetical protein